MKPGQVTPFGVFCWILIITGAVIHWRFTLEVLLPILAFVMLATWCIADSHRRRPVKGKRR